MTQLLNTTHPESTTNQDSSLTQLLTMTTILKFPFLEVDRLGDGDQLGGQLLPASAKKKVFGQFVFWLDDFFPGSIFVIFTSVIFTIKNLVFKVLR